MLKLKGCPRCQGALYLASDMYGKYVNCLQCGFTRDIPSARENEGNITPAKPAFQAPQRKAA